MIDFPATQEGIQSHETPLDRSVCLQSIRTRIQSGKPADILVTDIDGTLYEKEKDEKTQQWIKKGSNNETSRLRKEKNIADVVVSARPDYGDETDAELGKIGYEKPEVIIAGAGTLVYWRTEKGLELDTKFLQKMKNQEIAYKDKTGKQVTQTYEPNIIKTVLTEQTLPSFQAKGLRQIRIDTNKGLGFTTLDLANMSFNDVKELAQQIRSTLQGVKVEFSEDLESVHPDSFTGWMQIIPQAGGKDSATRFVLEEIAGKINPFNAEEKPKPVAHIVGDSSVDIWMLAMGAGKKDPYQVQQYVLENVTPYAKDSLGKVQEALQSSPTMTPLKKSLLETQLKQGWRRANIHLLTQPGPEGVFSIVNGLK